MANVDSSTDFEVERLNQTIISRSKCKVNDSSKMMIPVIRSFASYTQGPGFES